MGDQLPSARGCTSSDGNRACRILTSGKSRRGLRTAGAATLQPAQACPFRNAGIGSPNRLTVVSKEFARQILPSVTFILSESSKPNELRRLGRDQCQFWDIRNAGKRAKSARSTPRTVRMRSAAAFEREGWGHMLGPATASRAGRPLAGLGHATGFAAKPLVRTAYRPPASRTTNLATLMSSAE